MSKETFYYTNQTLVLMDSSNSIYQKISLLIILLITLSVACQTNNEEDQATANASNKKVQALLLTQPFEYDSGNKNKVTGEYVNQSQLVVPNNLDPQNKWVMFEGPVLENDLIAYRFYMDSRHRNDIYGKRVKNLVMDTVSWNYHDIMVWGSDILKVGESLGIGSPAIWYQDSVYAFTNYTEKTVEVTDDEDEYANIRTTFSNLKIGDVVLDVAQDWSIRAGEPWCEIKLEVLKGKMSQDMHFATGIVKHLEDYTENSSNGFRYAFTWGPQSYHEENMGMGIIMPETLKPDKISNDFSHVYLFRNAENKVNYHFLAAWERDVIGVKSSDEFQLLIEQASQSLRESQSN